MPSSFLRLYSFFLKYLQNQKTDKKNTEPEHVRFPQKKNRLQVVLLLAMEIPKQSHFTSVNERRFCESTGKNGPTHYRQRSEVREPKVLDPDVDGLPFSKPI